MSNSMIFDLTPEMLAEKKTNKGCSGHYWTKVMVLDDMRATEDDIRRYYESKRY